MTQTPQTFRSVARGVIVETRARGFESDGRGARKQYIRQNGIQPFYADETIQTARQRFAAQYGCKVDDVRIVEWNL